METTCGECIEEFAKFVKSSIDLSEIATDIAIRHYIKGRTLGKIKESWEKLKECNPRKHTRTVLKTNLDLLTKEMEKKKMPSVERVSRWTVFNALAFLPKDVAEFCKK